MTITNTFRQVLAWGILAMTFALSSCSQQDDLKPSAGESYIKLFLRNQGNAPSINQDAVDFEDRVNSLALLVFPTGATQRDGYNFVTSSSGVSEIPATKVKAGRNDLYILANCKESEVKDIVLRSQAEELLYKQTSFALHAGASAGNDFRMARVYRDQEIAEGGTLSSPIAFTPPTAQPLMPITEFGTDPAPGKVGLVRACSKIDVWVKGEGYADVKTIELLNSSEKESLAQLKDWSLYQTGSTHAFAKLTTTPANKNSYRIYMPERLFSKTANVPSWNLATDMPVNGTLYFQITTKAGRVFKVPVIFNELPSGADYMKYAKGDFTGLTNPPAVDYNVPRNQQFIYTIEMSPDSKEIVVTVKILPWTKVDSQMQFGYADFELKFLNETDFNVTGREKNIIPVSFVSGKKPRFSFRLKSPKGARWSIALTNGLDFAFVDGSVTTGIGGAAPQEFTVELLKPWGGKPRATEIYATVNGEEIQLVPAFQPGGSLPHEPGPGYRYVVKQIKQD